MPPSLFNKFMLERTSHFNQNLMMLLCGRILESVIHQVARIQHYHLMANKWFSQKVDQTFRAVICTDQYTRMEVGRLLFH